jgi:UDP:flavonoid glycosyltransferase YjiC (YdhE family)
VLSTAGNQLVGETMHLGKPILVVPEPSLEQRVNADAVVRLGIGDALPQTGLNACAISAFLANEARYREATRRHARDGRADALEALDEFARQLTGQGIKVGRELRRAA